MNDERIRYHLLQRLGNRMSELSEDCYAAGWMMGWETECPERLFQRANREGHEGEEARELIKIAEYLGYWATDSRDGYVPGVPFTKGNS